MSWVSAGAGEMSQLISSPWGTNGLICQGCSASPKELFWPPILCVHGFCGLYSPVLLVTGSRACPAIAWPHEHPSLMTSALFVTVHSYQLPPGPATSDALRLPVPRVEHLSGVPHRSIVLHLHPLLHGVQARLDTRVSQAGEEQGGRPGGPCKGWEWAKTPTWVSPRPELGSWTDG